MGQARPLIDYFRSFFVIISIQIEKSIDGVLGDLFITIFLELYHLGNLFIPICCRRSFLFKLTSKWACLCSWQKIRSLLSLPALWNVGDITLASFWAAIYLLLCLIPLHRFQRKTVQAMDCVEVESYRNVTIKHAQRMPYLWNEYNA